MICVLFDLYRLDLYVVVVVAPEREKALLKNEIYISVRISICLHLDEMFTFVQFALLGFNLNDSAKRDYSVHSMKTK